MTWLDDAVSAINTALEAVFVKKVDRSHISYGQVDSTSTSTVFTATVPGLTSLTDGSTVMLRNGVVNSATGFTLNVNGLGAKPVYSSMHNATADTTIYKSDYTMLFVYDSTRVTGGCWICYRGYNTNDNTIGYQIRTNSTKFTSTDGTNRYRLYLETADGNYMPTNTSSSNSANANKSTYMNTRDFWLGGKILYNSTDGAISANATMSATTLWQQYAFNLGYSFNNTSNALTLTSNVALYMVAEDRGNGKARLVSPYYTQTLPNSDDGKLYIYLGHMYSATNLELSLNHPIYQYKDGGVRLWSSNGHTHTKSQITDFPTIPSSSSDLSDGSSLVKTSNTTGLLKNDGSVMTSGTGSSNWAVGDHTHSGYANSTHTHTYTDVTGVSTVAVTVTYTDNTTETINLLKYTSS